MQINGATNSLPIYNVGKINAISVASTSQDQAVIGSSAHAFSALVNEANQMPDVRSEVVESYKSRIESGTYPTADTLSGLVDALGGSILRAAHASN